jgi:hypothetical protein
MRYVTLAILWCSSASAQAPVPKAADAATPSVKPEDKCSVEGTVVSATTGEPLKKTELSLRPVGQSGGTPPYRATTNAGGHFEITGIDPGRYDLLASRTGYLWQYYSPRGDVTQRRTTPLTLDPGQKLKEIVFKLMPQGVISGRVLDEDGEPLENAWVSVSSVRYSNGKRQITPKGMNRTNDVGESRMAGLSPGKYVISAGPLKGMYQSIVAERAVGSGPVGQALEEEYVTTYYPNSTNPESAAPIDIAPGAQVSINITLVRTRTARIKGRVSLGISGQVPRGARLFLARSGAPDTDLDAQGNFQIRGVVPGSYVLLASYDDDGKRYTARLPLEVSDSNIEGIDLKLQAPVEIRGRVIIEESRHETGEMVIELVPKTPEVSLSQDSTEVKGDLTFKLNAGLEQYDIGVYRLPEGFYLKSIRIGQQDITETGLDLTQGVPAEELILVLNPNGSIAEGSVKNAKAEAASGVMVTLIPDASHRSLRRNYKTTTTDQNGRFIIKGVPPGEYKIYAWEEMEGRAFEDPDFMKPHESEGEAVSFKEGSHETVQLK